MEQLMHVAEDWNGDCDSFMVINPVNWYERDAESLEEQRPQQSDSDAMSAPDNATEKYRVRAPSARNWQR
jgi:hypothetical protein